MSATKDTKTGHEEHEDYEGGYMPLSIVSTLPEETEVLIERVIGAALEVHRRLGPGFLESIYLRAMCIELAARSIPFECERSITVVYRDTPISGQRVDLIVANALILELKAVSRMDPVFQAKLISYLRTTGIRAGLLINFNLPLLKEGIKRIVV